MEGKCCKCEEYNWPDPQEVVWKDPADGKGYCVFHAPKEQKWKGLVGQKKYIDSEFNELVFSHINSGIDRFAADDRDELFSLSGTVFPGDISFTQANHRGPFPFLNLSKATFNGKVSFIFITINGPALFEDTTFNDHVSFFVTQFRSSVLFTRTNFKSGSLFVRTVFELDVDFFDSQAQDRSMHMRYLSKQSLGNVSFTPSEFSAFSFYRCDWPLRLRKGDEELYRAMKQRAVEEHDQLLVSRWHFCEKLMQLKGLLLPTRANALIDAFEDDTLCDSTRMRAWRELFSAMSWRMRRSLLFLYWTSSGFGERPRRAAVCLVGLAFLPLLLLIPLKLLETGWSLRPDALKVGEVLAEWVRCLPLVKLEATLTPAAPIVSAIRAGVSWLFQMAIALQAGLFALAVRNRFRR